MDEGFKSVRVLGAMGAFITLMGIWVLAHYLPSITHSVVAMVGLWGGPTLLWYGFMRKDGED
jgi:hypothetical protein